MCLITNRNTPFIAKKDIHVYKYLRKYKGELFAPVVPNFEYTLNKLYVSKCTSKPRLSCVYDNLRHYALDKGWFHSVTNSCDLLFNNYSYIYKFRAKIPKGSKYFVSLDGTEICSNQIIILDSRWNNFKKWIKNLFKL